MVRRRSADFSGETSDTEIRLCCLGGIAGTVHRNHRYLGVCPSWVLSVEECSVYADLLPGALPCWFLGMEYTLPLLFSEASLELLFEAGHLVGGHDTKSHKKS